LDTGSGAVTISLRARLFMAVAAILAVSIAVTAVLTRRATLFELRTTRGETIAPAALAAAVGRVQTAIADGGSAATTRALEAFRRETNRGFLLLDASGRVLATSNPGFARAIVSEGHDDSGEVILRLTLEGNTRMTLLDVPAFDMRLAGAPARLFVLFNPGVPRQLVQPWLLSAAATGLVALVLVFGLARGILRPIGALTDAARRMKRGDLAVRVDAGGGDEIAELARAFNSMAAQLAENERLRRQLIGDVAHELRSPVTNLRCLLEGVQDGLERADAATIATLYDETMFLQRLISDLQELTLAEAGSLPLHIAPTDVSDVIGRAVSSMAAAPGSPTVVVEAPRELIVLADPDRLEQVLRNLLANARQHTPAGGRVAVRAARIDDEVKIEVSDTGSGIAAEHLPYVFDRFYRADASRTRTTGGAGLGLAIVRQLVTAHGGTVSAASDGQGHGATFRIMLRAA
jgi:signal transduction histidine kinase